MKTSIHRGVTKGPRDFLSVNSTNGQSLVTMGLSRHQDIGGDHCWYTASEFHTNQQARVQ
jgi:hypothetical protein